MCIPTNELADLVRQTKLGAAPQEARCLQIVIDTIEKGNVTARLDSRQSCFLADLTDKFKHFLKPEMTTLLRSNDFYGVDLPVSNAFARRGRGRGQVIVFDGLLHLIRYYADLITVLSLLQLRRPEAIMTVDDVVQPEALSFSSAGFAIMADSIETGRTPAAIGDILGLKARKNVKMGYLGAVLFILMHEVGHIHLGHLDAVLGYSERPIRSLAIDEPIGDAQSNEFEADAFAYTSLRDEVRQDIISSVLFFLGPFAFLEAFAFPDGDSHPLAVNRAAHLGRLMDAGTDAASQVARIIESQVAGIQQLAARRREAAGDLRHRIHERMPLDQAYRIVAEIKARVASDVGLLEVQ